MKKFKDAVYDYNDVVVALLIVIVAGAVILWRIGIIMNYPQYIASSHGTEQESGFGFEELDLTETEVEEFNENPDDIQSGDEGEGTDATDDETDNDPVQSGDETKPEVPGVFKTSRDATFTVPTGSVCSKIATLLSDANLVESAESFMQTVTSMSAETRLKAGIFSIPAGSTAEDIVRILSK